MQPPDSTPGRDELATAVPRLDQARLGLAVLRSSAVDLVVLKPAGMATELTRDPGNTSLLSRLRLAAAPGIVPRLVHRLDRPTRGLVVVALTKEAAAFHGAQIVEGAWDKYYLARIPSPRGGAARSRLLGLHKAHLKEDGNRSTIVHSGGKLSVMEVLGVEPAPGAAHQGQSHALVRLLTGRLHQVRVMMAGLGHPLISDELYAPAPGAGGFYLEHVALRHRAADTKEEVVAYRRDDPEREPIAPVLLQALHAQLGQE